MNMIPIMVTTQAVDHLYGSLTGLVFLIALAAAAVSLAMYIYINAPLNRLVRQSEQCDLGGPGEPKQMKFPVLHLVLQKLKWR